MTKSAKVAPLFLSQFVNLRDLLDLLAMLQDFREPFGSPEGLRKAIDLLVKIGQSFGVDPALLVKLRAIADDPRVFDILLAVVRYGLSFVQSPEPSSSTIVRLQPTSRDATSQSLGLAEWLAILVQIIELLRAWQQPTG